MRKKAFTLAEIMIIIGILGIIADMTIPSLVKQINELEIAAADKKLKSTLYSALSLMKANNGGSLHGLDLGNEIGNYLKTSKNCNITGEQTCWHDNNVVRIKQKNGTYNYTLGRTTGGIITADGMYVLIKNGIVNCNKSPYPGNPASDCYINTVYSAGWCGYYYMDVNGSRGPNLQGKDVRMYSLWSDGAIFLVGSGYNSGRREATSDKNTDLDASEFNEGGGCYNGNDYSSTNY